MTTWKVTVERPDGDGGWVAVAEFGTDDSPSYARYFAADTPQEAAGRVLAYHWPVSIHDPHRSDVPILTRDRHDKEARKGTAQCRMTVVRYARYSWEKPEPAAEPFTVTVADLRAEQIRQSAAELVSARAAAAEAKLAWKKAEHAVRMAAYSLKREVDEAENAGVDKTVVNKAKRMPRKSTPTRTRPSPT